MHVQFNALLFQLCFKYNILCLSFECVSEAVRLYVSALHSRYKGRRTVFASLREHANVRRTCSALPRAWLMASRILVRTMIFATWHGVWAIASLVWRVDYVLWLIQNGLWDTRHVLYLTEHELDTKIMFQSPYTIILRYDPRMGILLMHKLWNDIFKWAGIFKFE